MLKRQFTLAKNTEIDKWELVDQTDGRVLRSFRTLKMALARREIERAIENDGFVTIHRRDGKVETIHYPIRTRR